jgi:spore germination cell wall hydrolase CwlJ-like protein
MKINFHPIIAMLTIFISVCVLAMGAAIFNHCTAPKEVLPVDTGFTDTMHLASIINAECGVCGESEQRKTGSVVLNRVDSELFPHDIFCVITDDNQFGGYYTDNYYPKPSCLKIAKELMKGIGRVDSILYFWNPKTIRDTNFLNQMQGRILYKEKYHYYAY